MRIFKAIVPEEMQTHSFVYNIPGKLSIRTFPHVDHDKKEELEDLLEKIDEYVGHLNDAFSPLEQCLELCWIRLKDWEYIVLRDKRKGDFYFNSFFEEVR